MRDVRGRRFFFLGGLRVSTRFLIRRSNGFRKLAHARGLITVIMTPTDAACRFFPYVTRSAVLIRPGF